MPAAAAGRCLFPRERRVRSRLDFQHFRVDPHAKIRSAHFLFVVRRRDDGAAPARIGFAIGKKLGNAPERNRLRRLGREVFRLNSELFPLGVDVLVVALAAPPNASYASVRDEWKTMAERLNRAARPRRP